MNAPALIPAPRALAQLVPLDGRELARAAVGPPPQQALLPVRDLRVDRGYQRELGARSRALIRAMVSGWDWTLVQSITVAPLPGGLWELIDGQHRALAALTHGAIQVLPAVIAPAGERADAARAFVALNARRVPITPANALKAAIAAGDPTALIVRGAAEAAGARLLFAPPGRPFRAGECLAAGALLDLARRIGRAALCGILTTCVAAQLAPIRAEHLTALEALATDSRWSGARPDAARLLAALRDWDRLADEARLLALDSGEPIRIARATALWRRAGA